MKVLLWEVGGSLVPCTDIVSPQTGHPQTNGMYMHVPNEAQYPHLMGEICAALETKKDKSLDF